ncbi:hypothetical protein QBC44DRAFT_373172 [Cladorrhinum sp. PSN332]|nr:hypothetical protein QBC44DRAFT_373172 [Cladorrhinum sp. PSN332]
MQIWTTLGVIAALLPGDVRAQVVDGKGVFGPLPAIFPNELLNHLGCQTISCVCREDLISRAQTHIRKTVTDWCGTSAGVDVDQALKFYNDYRSVNGYPIPGWTYVRTQTVRVAATPTTRATSGAAAAAAATAGNAAAITPADGGAGAGVGVGGQPTVTAVVTVTRLASSAASSLDFGQLSPPHQIPFSAHFSVVLALPALTSVITEVIVNTPGVPVSTQFVTQVVGGSGGGGGGGGGSNGYVWDGSESDNDSAGSSAKKSDDDKGLTKLEIFGIVVGIITGLVTMVVTVWQCICK